MISLLAAKLGIGEIILIIACALIVVGVAIAAIVRKVKGKPGCDCDCGCCSGCTHCAEQNKPSDDNNLTNK